MKTLIWFVWLGSVTLPLTVTGADNLNDITVWTFDSRIYTSSRVDSALYFGPGYCKRAWFKYSGQAYNFYPQIASVPPQLNAGGALFEGGVQVPNIQPGAGWPHDNPYDDNHSPPYRIPDPVFSDLVSCDADGNIYWINSIYFDSITVASVANENHLTYVLYWAYQQIDANVNALEFDQIGGAYLFSTSGVVGDNPNLGYDDYALGTANFANRISLVSNSDSLFWMQPQANADSEADSAINAIDDNPATSWHPVPADSHWIKIDFNRTRTIQQVYLRFPGFQPTDSFSVTYWDGAAWSDFSPPINVAGNTDSIRSFLVEPVTTEQILFSTPDNEVWLAELQLFGQCFRQFLLNRYGVDSGWTPTDLRWETKKLVDLSDTSQCPDGTMNTFNFRAYLQAHGWTGNPLGGDVDTSNFLDPPNPLFRDWGHGAYYGRLINYFFDDSLTRETIKSVFEAGYDYQRQQRVWTTIRDSVRAYAAASGTTVFVTTNGSARGFRKGADYLLDPLGGPPMLPMYPVTDTIDTLMHLMDGTQAMVNIWRMRHDWGLSFMDDTVPVVAFIDFGHQGNLFSHLGGYAIYGYPADVRAEYLRCYPMEMYAAGYVFCFPVREDQFHAWLDTLSDGSRLTDVVKQQTDFLNAHGDIYRNVEVCEYESAVTVNGVVPFNGEWKVVNGQLDSPVNESKVTISYMQSMVKPQEYLHIINHNWDNEQQRFVIQESLSVTVPVAEQPETVLLISPDFADTLYPAYTYSEGMLNLSIPSLHYYAVVIISFESCCTGSAGNVDGDPDDNVNVADLTYLVDYLFRGGPPPPCFEEGDVNGDGSINVADLTYIVDYLFRGGPQPPACP